MYFCRFTENLVVAKSVPKYTVIAWKSAIIKGTYKAFKPISARERLAIAPSIPTAKPLINEFLKVSLSRGFSEFFLKRLNNPNATRIIPPITVVLSRKVFFRYFAEKLVIKHIIKTVKKMVKTMGSFFLEFNDKENPQIKESIDTVKAVKKSKYIILS